MDFLKGLRSLLLFIFTLGAYARLMEKNKKLKEKNRELSAHNTHLVREGIKLIKEREAADKNVQNMEIKVQALSGKIDKLNKSFSLIAHDLRSPFSAAIGFSELMVRDYDVMSDEKRKYLLRLVSQQINNVFDLLTNLLSWSRLRIGQHPVSPINLRLKEIGDSVIGLLQAKAYEKQINLVNAADESTIINADANIVETVIRNLIANAIKFTNSGGRITLSTIIMDNVTQVLVTDTGIGIQPENIDKLFNPEFFSTSGTNHERGTGLGLQLCKEMIEEQGENIFVLRSKVGEGTTIVFTAKTAASI